VIGGGKLFAGSAKARCSCEKKLKPGGTLNRTKQTRISEKYQAKVGHFFGGRLKPQDGIKESPNLGDTSPKNGSEIISAWTKVSCVQRQG